MNVGVNYDVGMQYKPGTNTRELMNEEIMEREMEIVYTHLNSHSVRIYGQSLERLMECSRIAARKGLQVWVSPRMVNATKEETLDYVLRCAREFEKLRREYTNVVFVVGCEWTLDVKGFVEGTDIFQRMGSIFKSSTYIKNMLHIDPGYNRPLNRFLTEVVSGVRTEFHGTITYASGAWERVEWSLFDVIGVDYYRNKYNSSSYVKGLWKYAKQGKPVAILEFGCCTYQGAQDKGAWGYDIVVRENGVARIPTEFHRDEKCQADYVQELIHIFEEEGIQNVFVFELVTPSKPYDEDSSSDLDMASFALIRVYPDAIPTGYSSGYWEPKESFRILSRFNKGVS